MVLTMQSMNDQQLLRYSRQIMLPDFDYEGQQRLLKARVLVIGLGGLGSPVTMYLAAAGVGHLVLVDDDKVDASNLQRQIAHIEANIGQYKVFSAAASIQSINGDITVTCINERLQDKRLIEQVQIADVVVDCSDNQETRQQLNQVCWRYQTPLVFGAAIRFEGQLTVIDGRQPQQACYTCLYPAEAAANAETCADNGVIAPVVGIVGAMQAMETIKLIAQVGQSPLSKLWLYDGMSCQWRSFSIPKRHDCCVCGAGKEGKA